MRHINDGLTNASTTRQTKQIGNPLQLRWREPTESGELEVRRYEILEFILTNFGNYVKKNSGIPRSTSR
jgi:hypothetical protein